VAPTEAQLQALNELQKEAEAYEAEAKDYRATITRIIKHHYEEKRRRIITSLDREIKIETEGLHSARDEAIKRLEIFVARYSGPNAHPKDTPDAMFRLAALHEEKAREFSDEEEIAPGEAPEAPDLSTAVALYKRVVVEFPNYDELASVFYYLGHAYNDMGRIEEAQQVFRSLTCRNHFTYPVPPDPEDPEKDSIGRLPQDHDDQWWLGWMQRHPEPVDQARKEKAGKIPRRGAPPPEVGDRGDEDVFLDPYPDDCTAVAQDTEPGEDPRYLAEIWWRIGDYHFEEMDPWGGPFNLNRAESAYRQSMKFEKPPVYGVAMYKLAWTFYKQQRYETAVREFVRLLHYTDAQEKLTGNPGADFRAEAYAYIAGSMTYLDFEGPGPDDPYIARNDIFDLESDAAVVEEKMHVAIDRVQDPELISQSQDGCVQKTDDSCPNCCKPRWTVEIYKALAFEYKEYNHYHNLIDINQLILKKWPMHRDAPMVQNQIAEVYEQLAGQSRGTQHEQFAKLALEARGNLINYVATPGNVPPWVEANKEDPEAIREAERLVRGGLRRAAADHTNAARQMVKVATDAEDAAEKQAAFEQALRHYRLASKAWGGYLLQDENSDDAYESRYWLADAYSNIVLIQLRLGIIPSANEITVARVAARDVRDSNEDDKYLQPAALMVVRIAQQIVVANYDLHDTTGGAEGFPKRTELEEVGEGDEKTYVKKEIPRELTEMIAAFDEYIARVPVDKDPYRNHDRFAYTAGEIPFLYGQFDEARKRLNPIYQLACGKTEYGYLAWEKLITMANKSNDFDRSRELAQASKKKSCAVTADQEQEQLAIADPSIQRGYYQEASKAYEVACYGKVGAGKKNEPCAKTLPSEGPQRKKDWKKAAELYEGALRDAPERKEAPEAAILGASSYKQIGEYDKAIAMYELFIKEYGKEETLGKLKNGDPETKKGPDKKAYDERVKFLKVAYDALAEAYVLFFDYRRAAQTYDKIAHVERFKDDDQRVAARNAVFLYINIGDRAKMAASRSKFLSMNPPGEQKAEVEWLIATADLKEWDKRGPDRGANRTARMKAMATMDKYYRRYARNSDGAAYAVQAAFHASTTRRIGKDPAYAKWCNNTVSAYDSFASTAGNDPETGKSNALGSLQAGMAAECEYRAIDADLKKKFDYDAGHHRYKGVIVDVRKEFTEDIEVEAKGWYDKLQHVIDKYLSPPWAVAARARQGSLYDSCRTGLFQAREPGLKLYLPKEEKMLKKLDKLCIDTGSEKACNGYDDFTAKRRALWRKTRDEDLASADRAMVSGYAEAVVWSKAWKVHVDAVDDAVRRLAFYTDIIGDPKLRDYSSGVTDIATNQPFVYQDKMFMRMRRGMIIEEKPKVLAAPLPVVPQ